LRGRQTPPVAALDQLLESRSDLYVCGLIVTEVLQGIRDERQYAQTELLLSRIPCLPMVERTFVAAARICRDLRSRGTNVRNTIDCLIAAVALEHEVNLLSTDRDFALIEKHFPLNLI
jgi:hypothetical protein